MRKTFENILKVGHEFVTCNSDVHQILQVVRQLLPDVRLRAVEVVQTDQVAVPDLVDVAVVVDVADRLVEVVSVVGNVRVALSVRVE